MVKFPTQVMRCAAAVDLVILTIREGALHVLLVQRKEAPFLRKWALPGGFVREGEGLERAARRELAEETGIEAEFYLEQLQTYGEPKRDPRGRVLSVAYLALAPGLPTPTAGGDAHAAAWVMVTELEAHPLAFDHAQIVRDGIERARAKLEYTTLATAFCHDRFTIPELRGVYECVWGTELDPANFYRKVTRSPGFVEELDSYQRGGEGRPARLYRKGAASHLNPPINRTV